VKSLFPWLALWVPFLIPVRHIFLWACAISVLAFIELFSRIKRSNFRNSMTILGVFFGMPMFVYLLLRSRHAHAKGIVAWKGRSYDQNHSTNNPPEQTPVSAGRIS